MNTTFQPEPFSDFGSIWLSYVFFEGLITILVIFPITWAVLFAVGLATKKLSEDWLGIQIGRFSLFLAILLPVGGLANAFWCCLVSGNLYFSADIDSPEDDFSPFFPPAFDSTATSFVGNTQVHTTLFVNLHYLDFIWLLFAALSWSISFLFYRLIRQMARRYQQPLLPDPLPSSQSY